MGHGVKRLDPGTVNLPIWVGECPMCKPKPPFSLPPRSAGSVLKMWIKNPPSANQ
jgi:hypothetical protein